MSRFAIVPTAILAHLAAVALADDSTPWKNGVNTITVDGRERTFRLELPDELRPGAPLVLVFHGSGGSAEGAQREHGFAEVVRRHGVVAVYPDATRETNDDRSQQFFVEYEFQLGCGVDDVAFVHALVQRLVADLGLDPDAVFATGMSNGGDMSYYLSSQPEPIVRAIAPVTGTMMVAWAKGFGLEKPISLLAVNAIDDTTTRWNGDLPNQDGWGAYHSVNDVLGRWVETLQAKPDEAVPLNDNLTLRRWDNKQSGAKIRLYEFKTGGHVWPDRLGDPNATTAETIWQFFAKHCDPATPPKAREP